MTEPACDDLSGAGTSISTSCSSATRFPLASAANSGAVGGRVTRMAVTLGFFAFRTSSTTLE